MRGSVLALVIAASAWAVPPGGEATKPEPAPRADRYGDPLPDGAVGRMGTVRFRIGGHISALVVSPDGKRVLVAGNDGPVHAFDATSGRRLSPPAAHRENWGT